MSGSVVSYLVIHLIRMNWGLLMSGVHHKVSILEFSAHFHGGLLKNWNYTAQHHFKCIFQMCDATDENSRSISNHLVCSN